MKNYLKSLAYLLIMIISLTVILSLINYLTSKELYVFKILIPIISMFIAALILGRNVKNKAYIEGIKFSLLYLLLSIIIHVIIHNPFSIKNIIYYLVIMFSSVIGSMLGINLKKNK